MKKLMLFVSLVLASVATAQPTAVGAELRMESATAPALITNRSSAATCTSSVASFKLKPLVTLDANDLVLQIANAADANLFSVDLEGDGVLAGGITIGGGQAITKSFRGSATLNFAAIFGGSCGTNGTITVTGAALGDDVAFGPPNAAIISGGSNSIFQAWVSAANTVSVKHCCNDLELNSCDPPSGTFTVRTFTP